MADRRIPPTGTRKKLGSKTLNFLFFCNDLPYFSAHRLNLAKPLLGDSHSVTLLAGATATGDFPALPDQLAVVTADIDRHRFTPLLDMKLMTRLFRLLRRERPDVLHAITIKPNIAAAIVVRFLGLFGLPRPRMVLTFPGLGRVFEPVGAWQRMRRRLVVGALRLSLRGQDFVATFENPSDRQCLVDLGVVPDNRAVAVAGAGVDTKLFHPPAQQRTDAHPTILYASRLLRSKGIDLFVASARRIAAIHPHARFVIAGAADPDNPDGVDIETAIADTGDDTIDYRGAVPLAEMPDLFRRVDVVCLPSRLREGFPRSLIEAAACGCALIGTDQPSVRQIVHPGENGWLVPMEDEDALTAALAEACEDIGATRIMGRASSLIAAGLPIDDQSVFAVFAGLYGLTIPAKRP